MQLYVYRAEIISLANANSHLLCSAMLPNVYKCKVRLSVVLESFVCVPTLKVDFMIIKAAKMPE